MSTGDFEFMDDQKAGPPEEVNSPVQCNCWAKCKLCCRSLSAEEAGKFFSRDGRTISRLRAKGAVRYFKLGEDSYRYYLPHLIEDLTVRETPEAEGAEPEPPKGSDASAPEANLDKIKKDLKEL